jgi:hypothetical protein
MTTAARQHAALLRPAAGGGDLACVRWPISAPALLGSPAAARLNGHAPRLASCELTLRVLIEAGHAAVHAALDVTLSGGERESIPVLSPGGAPAQVLDEGSRVHVDAPGVLAATLLRTPDGLTLAYARTPLLAATLGLPGGVYDAPTL